MDISMKPTSVSIKDKKSTPYHHGDLRQALIDSAIVILEEEGFKALSLRAVARKAGVSQAAPYNHFEDKNEMLAAIAAKGFEEMAAAQQLALQQSDEGKSKLIALGKGYVSYGLEHPALLRLMFGPEFAATGQYPQLSKVSNRGYQQLIDAVEEHITMEAGDHPPTKVGAAAAWAMVHGLTTLMIEGRIDPDLKEPEKRDAFIEQVITVLATGL